MAKPHSTLVLLVYLLFLLSVSVLLLPCDAFSLDSPTDRRLLVLLDDLAIRSSHSRFFSSLQSRGFDLDFKLADDPSLALRRYGQFVYDGLVIFSPSAQRFGGSLDLATVLDFVDAGHDLILAADSSASNLIREVATECGVDFDEDHAAVVIDHTSYAISKTEVEHTLIAADDFFKSDVILGEKETEAPILFRGIGHSLNADNSLALTVLSASPAAYSANPRTELSGSSSLTDTATSLVSVVQVLSLVAYREGVGVQVIAQARNNARILITGSIDMFSNRFLISGVQKAGSSIKHEKSGNEQFVTEISKWVFHERGHLKAVNLHHHKVGETNEPSMYRINDDLEYSVEIYEWSGSSWKPYVAEDIQVQFYMMNPYVLKTLSTDQKGLYSTSFKVPDVYGVFQFKVEYQKLGYTSLSLSKQISVRPFWHNEYERFITTAFPYYGASFSTMSAFLIFTIAYLYNK